MSAPVDRAMEAFNAGDWARAKALCLEALEANNQDADALLVLGHIHAAQGEAAAAEAALGQARSRAPAEASFLANLGAAYSLAGSEAAARAAYEAALRVEPGFPRALCGLGDIAYRNGSWDEARQLFERALETRPDFPRALASLADLALRENRDAEGRALAAKAAALNPDLPAVQLILAELAISDAPAEAVRLAERVLAGWQANAQQRAMAMDVKARALEKDGRFDEAFAAFEQANELTQRAHPRFDPAAHPLSAHRLEQLIDFIGTEDPRSWPRSPADVRPAPVFLVGFPRSGTTLMGQVLGAHPQAETIEENDSFDEAVRALLAGPDLRSWSGLTPQELARLRDAYWLRVRQHVGRVPDKSVVIDKMPMNMLVLPVIHLLFPGAKIIFALRDPCDAVMSCFKQNFAPNYATANFWTLASSASYYDLAMRVAGEARRRLPLDVHELRYEQLTADFDEAVGAALSFLGLPWDNAVRAFAQSAREARIKTPSARSVVQPISQAPSGAWRRYAAQLAPHRALLDRWAAALGYEVH
jgi:tetratricopeptide (TPR) repeat protein